MKTRKTLALATLALAAAASLTLPLAAQAQQGPWQVRVRALNLDPANKDGTGLNLSVNSKTFPEVDFSYYFSPQLSAELILTYPQKHTVKAGNTEIGSIKHLPPTLTAQYHFTDLGSFVPYVGAGINYTRFSSVNLPPGVTIKNSSVGAALQAGVDVPIDKTMTFNFDVKKVQIATNVTAAGVERGKFKVDPLLVGIGLGWRF
ncbi:MAG TPA: OmpW family outer membrane protein [Burkholderiaceae bacterium]|nr:OmpW family outer membrane protein [Burkholderiaceae bacterium]